MNRSVEEPDRLDDDGVLGNLRINLHLLRGRQGVDGGRQLDANPLVDGLLDDPLDALDIVGNEARRSGRRIDESKKKDAVSLSIKLEFRDERLVSSAVAGILKRSLP